MTKKALSGAFFICINLWILFLNRDWAMMISSGIACNEVA